MAHAAVMIYWVIVALWATVLVSVVYFFIRNPKAFGTIRLLLIVIGIDTLRNIFENIYFGLYFGGQYGLFSGWLVQTLGQPGLLIVPKLVNVAAACVVLGLLLYHWLPSAVREWRQSEQCAEDLRTLAAIDALTGIYNRRQFEMLARAELARCQRYIRPLSLLVIDLDHFKRINDQYGHQAGDVALRVVATILTRATRDSDVAARLGGDEFAVLLPETTRDAARVFAERLCELIRSNRPTMDDQPLELSVSIGVADATTRTAGIETLFRNADQALCEAKRAGRDRVVVAAPMTERYAHAAE